MGQTAVAEIQFADYIVRSDCLFLIPPLTTKCARSSLPLTKS